MLFLTDTCFWMHMNELFDGIKVDLRPIIDRFRWGVTDEIFKEIEHHIDGPYFPSAKAFVVQQDYVLVRRQ